MNKYIIGIIFSLIVLLLICYLLLNKSNKISNIVSLGIPCVSKHSKFLDELINNINNQELLPYEIIISLSESNENEGKQLLDKLNKLSKVNVKIIVSEKKQYAGENRNICGKHCNTELISFIDSDDLMCPSRIQILENIYKNDNYDVLFHYYYLGDSISKCNSNYTTINDKVITTQQYKNNNITDKNVSVLLENVGHGHLTIKKDILNKYPIDINGYGEDTRYLHTLFENDLNVISLPDYKGTIYRIENSTWR
ncbi:MAG: hypothetical protein CMH79_06200 [Nitrospinae bacterium]|nr:hypothetical protein [Nitrospinota bacterium]